MYALKVRPDGVQNKRLIPGLPARHFGEEVFAGNFDRGRGYRLDDLAVHSSEANSLRRVSYRAMPWMASNFNHDSRGVPWSELNQSWEIALATALGSAMCVFFGCECGC